MFKDKVRIANQTLMSRVSIGIHSCKDRLGRLFKNNLKEAPFCRRWEQIQRCSIRHYSESKRRWNTALNGMSLSNPSRQRSGNPAARKQNPLNEYKQS